MSTGDSCSQFAGFTELSIAAYALILGVSQAMVWDFRPGAVLSMKWVGGNDDREKRSRRGVQSRKDCPSLKTTLNFPDSCKALAERTSLKEEQDDKDFEEFMG